MSLNHQTIDRTRPAAAPVLRVAQLLAVLTAATVVLIFGTAGVLVQDGRAEGLHGTGAVLLHVTSGLLTLALGVLAAQRRISWAGPIIAAALFGLSFLQASYGSRATLDLHVPGAFVISALAVGLTVWLLTRRPD